MNAHAMYNEVEAVDPDGLVAANADLVKRIAFHLMNRLPPSVQAEDLIQAGMIGLLEASRQYDPSQGASFETYAGIRVRGAMLDEIRRSDWTPRSVHRKSREAAEVLRDIEQQQGREAKPREVAEKLGIEISAYHLILTESSAAHIYSIDQPDEQTGETMPLPESSESTPGEHMEYQLFRGALANSISNLPEREALVMSLYYEEELNLREIGEILGVSESRVCQIHGQAMKRLKLRLAEWTQK
ncbi:MAG: RNA polymerase sigma factor FliA [Gammaproteobacteria bacterium]|nr:MAG: RNA polymerase sigma factor FliA [Gammaproteobacteria bacterium]PIE37138.1 MAG: RNA polymerase sigma factor FliA [Gammaproteobacteria bacterium]